MNKIRIIVLCAGVMALPACETSAVWYASHPEKKTVSIDGWQVNVVPRGDHQFDAWGGGDGVKTNTPVLKARQVKAIETASGCTVTSAEYAPNSATLQALVQCKKGRY